MPARDTMTIQALRRDVALQVARAIERGRLNQVAAARRLRVPQPTISKIVRGRVSGVSLELLLRTAVRAACPLVLQTGKSPDEAGAFLSGSGKPERARALSRVSEEARDRVFDSARRLTPEQRLEAHLSHSELVSALQRAGRRRNK